METSCERDVYIKYCIHRKNKQGVCGLSESIAFKTVSGLNDSSCKDERNVNNRHTASENDENDHDCFLKS